MATEETAGMEVQEDSVVESGPAMQEEFQSVVDGMEVEGRAEEGEPPRNLEDRMGEFHQNTHCFLDFSKYFF